MNIVYLLLISFRLLCVLIIKYATIVLHKEYKSRNNNGDLMMTVSHDRNMCSI
jgi:hypothetical protein